MAVRPAKLSDIMRVLAVAKEGHAASIYRDKGDIDEPYARALFARSVQRHGGTNFGGTLFVVAHEGEEITGYFLGFLDRVYQIGNRLSAQDVHFYKTPRCNPRDSLAMLGQFIDWAQANENVVEILTGKTDAMGEDDGRYGELLKRNGFSICGTVYRLGIERSAPAQAA